MEPGETEAAECTPPTPTAGRRSAGAPEAIPALYDLILWMAPKLARYPRVHRFTLGDRTRSALLEVLDGLIVARFEPGEQGFRSSRLCMGARCPAPTVA